MVLRNDWMHVKKVEVKRDILIVGSVQEEEIYEVVQLGPDCVDCRVGDEIVLYGLGGGGMFVYKSHEYKVCMEKDVICIMNREPEVTNA